MTQDIIYIGSKIPCKTFTLETHPRRGTYRVFFTTNLPPDPNLGKVGDLYLIKDGSRLFWKKPRKSGFGSAWREIGTKDQRVFHPNHPSMILRGGPFHPYPEWSKHDPEARYLAKDDLNRATSTFFETYERGSHPFRPIELE